MSLTTRSAVLNLKVNVFFFFIFVFSDDEQEHKDNNSVMAFICECKPRPGALSLEKCLQLGVPKGPLLGKLKNGETLTLENGTVVYPADVRDPDDPGPIFLGLNTIDNISVFCELNNY